MAGGVRLTEEDGLELVHPRIREEERGVVQGHDGRRHHVRVRALNKELDERLSNLVSGPLLRGAKSIDAQRNSGHAGEGGVKQA